MVCKSVSVGETTRPAYPGDLVVIEDDEGVDLEVKQHTPDVVNGARQRPLGCDVAVLSVVTL